MCLIYTYWWNENDMSFNLTSKTVGKESDFVILLNINTIYHLDMTDDNNTAVTANW